MTLSQEPYGLLVLVALLALAQVSVLHVRVTVGLLSWIWHDMDVNGATDALVVKRQL